MGLFEHHPAKVGAIRAAGTDSFAAAKQMTSFAEEVRGVSTAVPLAVEGTTLVDAARRPLRQVDRRALDLAPAFRLQGKAATLWADAVDDFNWRIDIWDQANPTRWQQGLAAAAGSPLLAALDDQTTTRPTPTRPSSSASSPDATPSSKTSSRPSATTSPPPSTPAPAPAPASTPSTAS